MNVEVVEYNSYWKESYLEESAKIVNMLGDELVAIYHIGSTSVEGLKAKPIIDIMPIVKVISEVDHYTAKFESLGYEVMGEYGIPGRRYFRKGKKFRTHQIHIFDENNEPDIERHLAVRDYLREHPREAYIYGELKSGLAQKFPTDIEKYCGGKNEFIKELERKAIRYIKNKNVILETNRLLFRKMKYTDYNALCKILKDEEVMYAYEHAFDDSEARQWLNNQMERYRKYGFGLWAVLLKETGEMIGQCGLTMQNLKGEQVLEIGYLFQKKFWHQGYALEAAEACKLYAFDKLDVKEVFSIIRDTNISSLKVAIKNGMTQQGMLVKHYYGIDMPHLIFAAKR